VPDGGERIAIALPIGTTHGERRAVLIGYSHLAVHDVLDAGDTLIAEVYFVLEKLGRRRH